MPFRFVFKYLLSKSLNSFKYFEIVEKYPKDKERIMMRFSDEWKEMREKRINKEITWSEYIEWKLNYHIKED